jgi:hypothetical protein
MVAILKLYKEGGFAEYGGIEVSEGETGQDVDMLLLASDEGCLIECLMERCQIGKRWDLFLLP